MTIRTVPGFRPLAAAIMLLGLGACADGYLAFPVTPDAQRSLTDDVEIIRLDANNIGDFTAPSQGHNASSLPSGGGWNYRVGSGDILTVIVFDHPELTLPAGPERSAEESGFRVQADGTFFYPFIGQVQARGRPLEQIREDLTERLSEFVPDPQLEVRVAAFNSQAVVVTGEVESPNRQPITTVPLSLVAAINQAGGMTDRADTRAVTLMRGGERHVIDLEGFFTAGITHNNPLLRDGDVVHVPLRRAQEAYLLGEVSQPNAIDLSVEPITLTQAISRQGGLENIRADARGVFVFRQHGEKMRVFQLETDRPEGLVLGTRFVLEPGDVIYVVRSPLQRWNDTISRILPSVQAASAAERIAR
ncbi:MAG: polysaccharide export outer membrane protein [Rhodobacteraceae bacterium HLUCCA12]|nr:MAG: polysaccharide export outer membrane protein [Rhodobacteraceae bacterium HLUCCA12]